MEIVIDIPENWEKEIKNASESDIAVFLHSVIRNGTPLKEGHWIKQTENVNRCSECELMVLKTSINNYCPNCGAKMQEEQE